jgi:uracil-DNA glycosylase family 4
VTLIDLREIESRVTSCKRCPRLIEYAAKVALEKKRAYADQSYWGRPVPAFGDATARVMLVGLAPGAHGSNRTGRIFTGDASGDFLYPALYRAGFASQPNATNPGDGMILHDCLITAAGRCAPPANKPTPAELRNCFSHLLDEFDVLPELRVIVGLGAIGFSAAVKVLRERHFTLESHPKFGHAVEYGASTKERHVTLLGCYHPSRQNTNTGLLTERMIDRVLTRAASIAQAASLQS